MNKFIALNKSIIIHTLLNSIIFLPNHYWDVGCRRCNSNLVSKGQRGYLPYVSGTESWMLNILWHQDSFKSCGYVFKVQTEPLRHFKDRLPLGKVGLVRVGASTVWTDQIWVCFWLLFSFFFAGGLCKASN